MPVGDVCPKCGCLTVVWEHEHNRWACLKLDCGYVKYKDNLKIQDLEIEKGDEDDGDEEE